MLHYSIKGIKLFARAKTITTKLNWLYDRLQTDTTTNLIKSLSRATGLQEPTETTPVEIRDQPADGDEQQHHGGDDEPGTTHVDRGLDLTLIGVTRRDVVDKQPDDDHHQNQHHHADPERERGADHVVRPLTGTTRVLIGTRGSTRRHTLLTTAELPDALSQHTGPPTRWRGNSLPASGWLSVSVYPL